MNAKFQFRFQVSGLELQNCFINVKDRVHATQDKYLGLLVVPTSIPRNCRWLERNGICHYCRYKWCGKCNYAVDGRAPPRSREPPRTCCGQHRGLGWPGRWWLGCRRPGSGRPSCISRCGKRHWISRSPERRQFEWRQSVYIGWLTT